MAYTFDTNLETAAINYAQQLGIAITKKAVKKAITEHPYYPSLYSLSNTFDKYSIENAAFKIDAEQLMELPVPFIAHTNSALNTDWVIITNVNGSTLTYTIDGKANRTIDKNDFINGWKNIVFAANKNEKSGDPNYAAQLKEEKQQYNKKIALAIGSIVILLIAATNFIYYSQNIIAASTILVLQLAGLFITSLLLVYDIDKTNTFVKNICTAGVKTNCDAVLNSKASKFLGITWSEAGWFYFAGITLFLLFPSATFIDKLPFIAIAASLSAMFIPFSIYYQYKVVKQWCILCLATQIILLLQLIWSIVFFWQQAQWSLHLSHLWGAGGLFLLPVIIWYTLKPILLKAKQAPEFEAAHKRLLYNPDIFNGLLHQQPQAPDGWQNLGIDIGNPEAENVIIKVCNPYCAPCAQLHPLLEEILQSGKSVRLKIIFNTVLYADKAPIIVKHLLNIYEQDNPVRLHQALNDWYLADKKNFQEFDRKFPINRDLNTQNEKLMKMNMWCQEGGIMTTPTLFVNGYRVPDTYERSELKNIL